MTGAPLPRAAQMRVLVPFVIVTLIWGSTWYVIRGQLGAVPVSWSVAYRFTAGSLAMVVAGLVMRSPLRLDARGQGVALLLGLAQFVVNFNLVYRAETYIASGLVAVVFALLVVPNAVLSRIVLGQEMSRRFLIGSAIALAGIALLFAHELRADPAGGHATALGVGFTLAGVLAASVANVLQGTQAARAQPMAGMLAWAMGWGALANAAIAWVTTGPPVFDASPTYVAGLLYLGVVASAFAFFLYYPLIRAIGPARAAYSSVLIPILAMGLSTLFEGYRWSLTAAAGVALVLAGLVVAIRARSPSRKVG